MKLTIVSFFVHNDYSIEFVLSNGETLFIPQKKIESIIWKLQEKELQDEKGDESEEE